MTLHDAVAADRKGELQAAAAGYEDALAGGKASLEVLLNLAVLYWQATDIGMAAAKKLSPEFLRLRGGVFLSYSQRANGDSRQAPSTASGDGTSRGRTSANLSAALSVGSFCGRTLWPSFQPCMYSLSPKARKQRQKRLSCFGGARRKGPRARDTWLQ